MGTRKPQPESKAEFELATETVKDLDPGLKASDEARGGANFTRQGGAMSINL